MTRLDQSRVSEKIWWIIMADSRSFLANQKARNAIVGAEYLLIKIIQIYERYDSSNKMQIE